MYTAPRCQAPARRKQLLMMLLLYYYPSSYSHTYYSCHYLYPLYYMYISFIGIVTLFDSVTRGYGDHSPLTKPKEEVTHEYPLLHTAPRWHAGDAAALLEEHLCNIHDSIRRDRAMALRKQARV